MSSSYFLHFNCQNPCAPQGRHVPRWNVSVCSPTHLCTSDAVQHFFFCFFFLSHTFFLSFILFFFSPSLLPFFLPSFSQSLCIVCYNDVSPSINNISNKDNVTIQIIYFTFVHEDFLNKAQAFDGDCCTSSFDGQHTFQDCFS